MQEESLRRMLKANQEAKKEIPVGVEDP